MGSLRVGVLVSITALGLLSGCRESINFDGSSTVYPLTEAVVRQFQKDHPGVRVTVGFSGTGGGMKKFSAGEIDVCDASRMIKPIEVEACEKAGVKYIQFQIAFDGLAVVVNPENDWCDCLTVEQLKALWRPNSVVKKWSDLNPDWPEEEIKLYGPGTDSGTFDYFTEAIMGEAKSSRPDYTPSEDDNMLVTGVQSDKYSLGYFGYAYYKENTGRLKLLGVDGGHGCIQPSEATVLDKSYSPLSRPLFIYVRKDVLERPEVKSIIDFYLANVAKLAPKVGYVPVNEEVAAENRKAFEEATAGMAAAGL